jgi:phospholipid/cholesterol/gamma-HCH transport system substrate-binding protein
MYSKINYTIVGVFVVVFSVALVAFGLWLSKYSNANDYKLYKIYFNENVSGLNVDSAVKLKGVDIGKVASISIDPKDINRVQTIVKIKKDIPIKEDMVAYLEPIGITGLLNIVIEGGTNKSKELLAKNGEIPVIKSRPSWLVDTKNSVANISKNLNESLLRLNKLLNEENIQNFSQTIANIKTISLKTVSLESNISKVIQNTDKTLAILKQKIEAFNIAHFNKLIKDSDKLVLSSKKLVVNTNKKLNLLTKKTLPLLKSFKKSSDTLRVVVTKVKKGLDRGNYNLKAIFEPMTIDLRLLTNSVNFLIRELEQSPSDMILKSRKRRKGPGE